MTDDDDVLPIVRVPDDGASLVRIPIADVSDGRRFLVRRDVLEIVRGDTVRRLRLDDLDRPVFHRLPVVDTSTGESLREEAFRRWAAAVRRTLARERHFAMPPRRVRPVQTALTLAGGGTVSVALTVLLGQWATRGRARVQVEPTLSQSLGQLLMVGVIVLLIYACVVSAARSWLLRGPAHVRIGRRGLKLLPGDDWRPFESLRDARYNPVLKLVRLRFDDGSVVRVAAGVGPFRRLDLTLAGLCPRLEQELRGSGALA